MLTASLDDALPKIIRAYFFSTFILLDPNSEALDIIKSNSFCASLARFFPLDYVSVMKNTFFSSSDVFGSMSLLNNSDISG